MQYIYTVYIKKNKNDYRKAFVCSMAVVTSLAIAGDPIETQKILLAVNTHLFGVFLNGVKCLLLPFLLLVKIAVTKDLPLSYLKSAKLTHCGRILNLTSTTPSLT